MSTQTQAGAIPKPNEKTGEGVVVPPSVAPTTATSNSVPTAGASAPATGTSAPPAPKTSATGTTPTTAPSTIPAAAAPSATPGSPAPPGTPAAGPPKDDVPTRTGSVSSAAPQPANKPVPNATEGAASGDATEGPSRKSSSTSAASNLTAKAARSKPRAQVIGTTDEEPTEEYDEDFDTDDYDATAAGPSKPSTARKQNRKGKSRLSNSDGQGEEKEGKADFGSRLAGGLDAATALPSDSGSAEEEEEDQEVQPRRRTRPEPQRSAGTSDEETLDGEGPRGKQNKRANQSSRNKGAVAETESASEVEEESPKSKKGKKKATKGDESDHAAEGTRDRARPDRDAQRKDRKQPADVGDSAKKRRDGGGKDKQDRSKSDAEEDSDPPDSADVDGKRRREGTPKESSKKKVGKSSRQARDESEEDTRGDADSDKHDRRKHSNSSKGRSDDTGARVPYIGDVSAWHAEDDGSGDGDSDMPTEMMSMSSGLSPRKPREEPWDANAAKRALTYSAGQYGRAQTARREGTAPAALGIADDLPTRLAYAQMEALAGMAGKVQDAILHNKRIFEHRMQMEHRSLLKKVWEAWRGMKYGDEAKQQKLRRAINRIQRGLLARAFQQWMDMVGTRDKAAAVMRKVSQVVKRGMLRRTFHEWWRITKERYWKVQYEMRDQEIMRLENRVRIYKRRPIYVMKNRKLRSILWMWWALSEKRRSRRLRMAKALRHFQNQALAKAWNTWWEEHVEARRHKDLLKKAVGKMRNVKMASAWEKWWEYVVDKHDKDAKQRNALAFFSNLQLGKAWNSWTAYTTWRRDKKQIIRRWMQPQMARAFAAWADHTQWRRRMKVIVQRAARRIAMRELSRPWDAWIAAVEEGRFEREHNTKETAEARVQELESENDRLRRDNERFVRLIDSGEWGRGRVAELVSAGEILKGERDALHKLIQSLRREHEEVVAAKHRQEDEMRGMKERMMMGGASRNRMLVKGASSFNALVRAMKQDLVDGSAAKATPGQQDPNLLYEIDKLSMDHVQVFPDGDLHIAAVASTPTAAGLAHSVTTGGNLAKSPPRHTRGAARGAPSPLAQGRTSMPTHPSRAAAAVQGQQGTPSQATQRVLSALRSLTPAEVDRLQMALPQAQPAAGPAGLASTAPSRR